MEWRSGRATGGAKRGPQLQGARFCEHLLYEVKPEASDCDGRHLLKLLTKVGGLGIELVPTAMNWDQGDDIVSKLDAMGRVGDGPLACS
jgi:hypothetical protein